ncbi:MAG: YkgJ family cysteine cluster protein [Fibrobacteres bacterium]|nr:YkgJ family cysteine cluster protein [Fibrobacterota bacterium]
MDELLRKLDELYLEFPPVPCEACGGCCVSPTCTIVEFAGSMRYAINHFSKEKLSELLLQKPEIHKAYDGNLHCLFQDKATGHCLIHPARTMACRLFGLPVINELSIHNLENCTKLDVAKINNPTKEKLTEWLQRLTDLNREHLSYYTEPYWVSGLNIESWLAVYFDPLLNDGIFGEMKEFLHRAFDINYLADQFRDETALKDKIDRIAMLYILIDTGSIDAALDLISEIRNGYPLTGTYYLEELEKIEKVLRT